MFLAWFYKPAMDKLLSMKNDGLISISIEDEIQALLDSEHDAESTRGLSEKEPSTRGLTEETNITTEARELDEESRHPKNRIIEELLSNDFCSATHSVEQT